MERGALTNSPHPNISPKDSFLAGIFRVNIGLFAVQT
jgi:hypothetical protein